MRRRRAALFIATLTLASASLAHAEDCFNDEVPLSSDLEPPILGSTADLLRITDEDVARVLADIAAHERRRREDDAGATAPAGTQ